MTIATFDQRVLIEQVRHIETQQTLASDMAEPEAEFPEHSEFEARLWHRAKRLVAHNNLRASVERPARMSRRANLAAMLVAALLGAVATLYAVTGDATINIYWLLLVLLGFNLLSMLLWLVGISLNLEGLIGGVLAKLARWLPSHLKHRDDIGGQADRAWLACQFGGRVGRWQLSTITHQLWLLYLLAGLGVLILALMARQYDFVWGTTLLSDAAFVTLTDVLSRPLHAMGFATPTAEQIQDTRIGALQTLTAAHRYNWAQFLLGSLLCFGVLPRLFLWGWSLLMRSVARRRFALDFYLPYYIRLRQELMPQAGHGEIVDADTAPAPDAADAANAGVLQPESQRLPAGTQWVAVELGDNITWPLASIAAGTDLGQVVDRTSLNRIQQRLKSDRPAVVAIAVAAARPPDRGVQRTIASLTSNSAQVWLVLLHAAAQHGQTIPHTRLAAWYRLAQASAIPADRVISMGLD